MLHPLHLLLLINWAKVVFEGVFDLATHASIMIDHVLISSRL